MNISSLSLTQVKSGHETNQEVSYRNDIDGMRALAVTAVVLNHAGLPFFPGGFIGVDIFFVISGYLVGGIVYRDILAKNFSFKEFYARRAKRILPALFAMMFVQWIIALLILTPNELVNFAKSAISALLGVSNIYFWRLNTDYFAPAAHTDPFLMTWSLGVEEQFYIVLPLLMLLGSRIAIKSILYLAIVASALSFLMSVFFTNLQPAAAFYLLPTRAWELGAGVILSILVQKKSISVSRIASDILSIAGIFLIVTSILFFDEATAFPGIAAVLPVFGTVALLLSKSSIINRTFLSCAPMRAIGLISYSWYLWHWPLMAFMRTSSATVPSVTELTIAAVVSLVCGYLSWKFVEIPFRKSKRTSGALLVSYFFGLTAWLAVPVVALSYTGFPQRLASTATLAEEVAVVGRGGACLAEFGDTVPDQSANCQSSGFSKGIVLLGDSHAAALSSAMRELAEDKQMNFAVYTKSSCPFLTAATRSLVQNPDHASECHVFNENALKIVIDNESISTVVIAGYWSAGLESKTPGIGYTKIEGLEDEDKNESAQGILKSSLVDTVQKLHASGKKVIILGEIPRFTFNSFQEVLTESLPVRNYIERTLDPYFSTADGKISKNYVIEIPETSKMIISDAAGFIDGAIYLDPVSAMCSSEDCLYASSDGVPYYFDYHHLSKPGAMFLLDEIGLFSYVN